MEKTISYINGFNDGYIIRKTHPGLFKKLHKGIKNKSPYFDGFEAGAGQYEKEMKYKIEEYKKDHTVKPDKKDRGMEM